MQPNPRSTSKGGLEVRCDRCGGTASVRNGRDFLCTTCAAVSADVSADEALVVCDRCDRESLVRLGDRFLCASCAMNVLRESVEDFEGLTTVRSLQPIELLTSGEPESVLAHGLEVGRMVREGTMPLVEAAAAHHQALARSMRGARDIDECVRRVEAGGVLFNVWAFSFDARLDDLERRNRALLLVLQELERREAEFH
jgi:hypothetical protein